MNDEQYLVDRLEQLEKRYSKLVNSLCFMYSIPIPFFYDNYISDEIRRVSNEIIEIKKKI